ncbi:hypothetical protein [Brachymonas sp.]|uniref:hypothetical protein n=1 Tax=Brachymonas sp. TaxID=1936292 RepID=UPI0035B17AA6
MAGVKGRSGGARPGAGRKPEQPSLIEMAEQYDDPKEFLAAVMNDQKVDIKVRVNAAKAMLPFDHARKGEGGKKASEQESAQLAFSGFFAPSAPPGSRVQ